jgi:LPXTG-motif cell wall-anchored protein
MFALARRWRICRGLSRHCAPDRRLCTDPAARLDAASRAVFHSAREGWPGMSARMSRLVVGLVLPPMGLAAVMLGAGPASAAQAPVGLGAAASFAILAGTTVTNTGPSAISGDLGVAPGSAVTGFPPGAVTNGSIHKADTAASQGKAAVTTAYNDAAGRATSATITADLGGQTLVPGVYAGGALQITGTLTLDAQGDPSAVFVFKAASTLITASSSSVSLLGGANACNVFWQVGSSATLGTNSVFRGTVLALTSVSAATGAAVTGRLLARNAAVTLDSNTVTSTSCAAALPSASVSATSTSTASSSGSTVSVSGSAAATSGGPTAAAGPTLPNTGSHAIAMALVGVVALSLGGVLLLSSRRPHQLGGPSTGPTSGGAHSLRNTGNRG